MSSVTMRQLLEAGVHFGHQTRRWNPKMKPYIHGVRNGIHILDLQRTMRHFKESFFFIRDLAAQGGTVLFVGTKKQAQPIITDEARRAGMPYIVSRWLGGTLTNFVTIKKSIQKLIRLEERLEKSEMLGLTKKEELEITRDIERLKKNIEGIRDMKRLPDALFIVDPKREHIAIQEARRLGIPIVAICDTNCDPDVVDYVIPANDDAIRSVSLIAGKISDAIIEGYLIRESTRGDVEEAGEAEEEAAADDASDDAPEETGDAEETGDSEAE